VAYYNKKSGGAMKIFEQMKNNKIQPNVITYNTLILMFLKSKNTNGAIEMYKQMISDNIQPDSITNKILENLRNNGHEL